jgi:hypothetical protein
MINLLAMTICDPASLLRVPSFAYGLQPFSRQLWTGRPWATHTNTMSSSYKYRVPSTTYNTRLELSSKSHDSSTVTLRLSVPTPEEVEEVGALLAVLSSPPDVLFLDGGTYLHYSTPVEYMK